MHKFYTVISVSVWLSIAANCFASPVISEQADSIFIQSGKHQYVISKKKCTVFDNVIVNNVSVATGWSISYVGNGNKLFITGQPIRTYIQKDHNSVYQEGWFQYNVSSDFLYYIIRYEFYENAPYVKLVATFTDRHDKPRTEAQWDPYWKNQWVRDIKVTLQVPSVTRTEYVQQHNAFDY